MDGARPLDASRWGRLVSEPRWKRGLRRKVLERTQVTDSEVVSALALEVYEATGLPRLVAELVIPGAEFGWRHKRKAHSATLPAPKGNSAQIVKLGPRLSVRPSRKATAAGEKLRELLPRAAETLDGPVRVEVEFLFVPPPSWSKTKRANAIGEPVLSRLAGDVDQLSKLLLDGLEGAGYFANDCLVVELAARKVYAETGGYRVWIYDLRGALS